MSHECTGDEATCARCDLAISERENPYPDDDGRDGE